MAKAVKTPDYIGRPCELVIFFLWQGSFHFVLQMFTKAFVFFFEIHLDNQLTSLIIGLLGFLDPFQLFQDLSSYQGESYFIITKHRNSCNRTKVKKWNNSRKF